MKNCFVLMPFSDPYNEYYTEIIKPVLEDLKIKVNRADEIYGNSPIIEDIINGIIKSDIIIADVSTKNPNVNYELGIAHALRKQVIIVSEKIEDIPFDYRHLRAILYDTRRATWARKFTSSLTNTIKKLKNEHNKIFPSESLNNYYSKLSKQNIRGISNTFMTRQNMNSYLSKLWKQNINQLDVCAFGLKSFRDSQTQRVKELIDQGLNIRILTPNPNSDYVKRREADENLVNGHIRKTILDLKNWANNNNKIVSSQSSIEVKYYNSLPLDFFWRQDNHLFVGPYLQGIGSQQSLTYEIESNSELGKFYLNYFESLWSDTLFCNYKY